MKNIHQRIPGVTQAPKNEFDEGYPYQLKETFLQVRPVKAK
ncbi:hypothetical protein OCO53_06080 [Peribacillus frigoritolerans]|nr:hypothetical protein [Peribacillus frigoritolerans]MCU6600034.1 hypothetical protein [Peribacillus frigoritolerans]